MVGKEPLNGSKQFRLFALEFSTNTGLNIRQRQFPVSNQQLHQIAARHAEQIRHHRIDLDVRGLKKLVGALPVVSRRLNLLFAQPRQVPPLSNRLGTVNPIV